jgi:hypothetical protein
MPPVEGGEAVQQPGDVRIRERDRGGIMLLGDAVFDLEYDFDGLFECQCLLGFQEKTYTGRDCLYLADVSIDLIEVSRIRGDDAALEPDEVGMRRFIDAHLIEKSRCLRIVPEHPAEPLIEMGQLRFQCPERVQQP